MNYKDFQKKYPKFIYKKYFYKISGNNLEIFFDFSIEPDRTFTLAPKAHALYKFCNFSNSKILKFQPKIIIENVSSELVERVGNRVLSNLIFHLGLMEIPSYWKATCSPKIEIKAGPLNKEQIKWWKELIIDGMGQFFYENKIDWRKPNFLRIISTLKLGSGKSYTEKLKNRYLVPIGGGKDSMVTLELLKKAGKNIQCFSLNPTEAAKKIMKIGKCKKPIIIRRKIDERLLELNRNGFLNGHTPFSAYLAFLTILVAILFDLKLVAVSNERSSNEGNVKYLGKIINHQWSKSFDFERKFREYSKKYLAKNVEYFSFLRPLYEIQITKLFSKYSQYSNAFLSCNVAYQTASGRKKATKKWCGNCPKCLFIFASLYPFVEETELIKIFGKDLFEERELLPIMQELIGERKFKPFECVGTKKESLIAFYLSWKRHRKRSSAKLPFLLQYFEEKILPKHRDLKKEAKELMNSWNEENNLSQDLEKILKIQVFF